MSLLQTGWAASGTDSASVANWTQTYIWRQALIPLAYRVPQVTMLETRALPAPGVSLQINVAVEQSEMASLSEVTTIAENEAEGLAEILYGKRTYTIAKKGKAHVITDLSGYSSLGDLALDSSNLLKSVGARTLSSLFYDAMAKAAGLRWLRQDGNTAAQKQQLTVDVNSTATSLLCDELTEADDFWNNGQVLFTSGKLTGQAFEVTDFANTLGNLTVATMPVVPDAGDKFDICTLGDDVSTVDKVSNTDILSLPKILLAATYCRAYGAASETQGGGLQLQYDAAGIRREVSPSVANGVVFLHDFLLQGMLDGMSDVAQAASQVLWQSDEGYATLVGGGLRRMGGLLFVPVNYHKRASVTDGTLSNTTGVAWPTVIMFKDCGLVTTLKDNKGDNHGLVVRSKVPAPNDIANNFDSIKMRNEMYMYNAFGVKNSLHGAVLWSGTQLAA